MADLKISQLQENTSPGTSVILPIVSGTDTQRTTLSNLLSAVYPVGCIYTSVVPTSPANVFGFGTWHTFGTGMVLVGIDASQAEFATVNQTGGATAVVLTTANLATHTHTQNSHTHVITELRDATTGGVTTNIALTADTSSTIGTKVTGGTIATNQNTGSDVPHANLQPYIVVHRFRRIA